MYPSWWKNRTLSHFSKPNFDMPWPNCCKSYKVNDDPPFFHPFLVKKNICRYLLFCTIALAFIIRELCFTKGLDKGCPESTVKGFTVLPEHTPLNFTYLGTPAPLWNPQYVAVMVWNTMHLVTCTSRSFLICTISPCRSL